MEAFFEDLCRIYRKPIECYLQKRGAGEEESRDIVSQGILVLYVKLKQDGYSTERRDEYIRLLYTVCKRDWLDTTRSSQFKNTSLDGIEYTLVSKSASDEYSEWTLHRAQGFIRSVFLHWNPRKGELLYQRYILRASIEDLAEDFNYASPNAVRVTCSFSRKDFIDWLYDRPDIESNFREALNYFDLFGLWEDETQTGNDADQVDPEGSVETDS